jgi:uncharacterized protein YdeI (YjbR/CyaY-like superfamily)
LPGETTSNESEHAVVAHRDREQFHAESRDEWQRWLADNHDTSDGVWLVSWKKSTGKPQVTYEECVEAALAYGWIDSTAGTLDDERSMLWFARRRPNSGWSRPNKERIARLEAAGLMAPPGKQAVEIAKENGSWTLLDDAWNLVVPDDLDAALAKRKGARKHWDAFSPSARRAILEWIVQAKREDTRRKRIEATADAAARGERAH